MKKQAIIRRLEEVWGGIPGWLESGSSASLRQYLERLGWEVGSQELLVRVNPAKVAIAEKLVSDAFGKDIQLAAVEIAGPGTGRAHIIRMRLNADDPDIPPSVIVKLVNEDYPWVSDRKELYQTFFNEWSTYEFFRRLGLPESIVPQFYGGDAEAGVMIIEDLGKVENTYDAAFTADASLAEEMLMGWMKTTGMMHALSMGHQEMFDDIRSALGPAPTRTSKTSQARYMTANLRQICELIGIKLRRGCVGEIERISTMISNPGAFAALSKGDNTPGDCVKAGPKLKLLDFEFSRYQHALLDATILRMIYPTAWRNEYRTPTSIIVRAEAAYRNELAKSCPQADDDVVFAQALVGTAAFWCFDYDGQFSSDYVSGLLEEDNGWGGRQRVVQRLKVLARASEEFGQFPAIGATARDLETRLRHLWPEVEEMAYYPAFAGEEQLG